MTPTQRRLMVLDIVGLTPAMIGPHTPHLAALARDGFMAPLDGIFPAVTTSAQASMLTGLAPAQHGIVGNGWYFRDLAEVWFWRQSNRLVHGEKVWETLRRDHPGFRCAKLFWWYNMYSSADWSVTPRPIYPADGRKIPGLYSHPMRLHQEMEQALGPFPFFHFWGPKADIASSRWIADAALWQFRRAPAELTLVYLPHLDYNLQRLGPDDPAINADITTIDAVAGKLIDGVRAAGADVLVVSEYGIEPVSGCVHINRLLREAGYLAVRETLGWELLDAGASRAFAVADHQVAHVYIDDPKDREPVRRLLASAAGIERVLGPEDKAELGIDHARSGELIAVAEPDHWLSYYYWLDDAKAPDFARTVDIHRKPGYDPVELFVDPALRIPQLKVALRLAQKRLGCRMLMDVIPLDPTLVKGSHGRLPRRTEHGPVVIGSDAGLAAERYAMTDIHDLMLRHFRH
ncbi:alkaline phosphatase family protein [Thiohalocapsa halophila]|uniref:Alkaline phosphatase family protein n=1 Tax=Thiohalocapsa halophila TaxID=69359 RepID=A0ABS1CE29_9GAMM|nr:nucleotide pyrophosphatase/phosphodiesterase family protein [Thiohalocapsa halophila]MBK1630157.1 alkaline phosphatase family protein [Thiohalocapsa halophila]